MPEADIATPRIIERLEMRGHRVTASRRRVIDALMAQPSHFTVDDVLRDTGKTGRATVFRTMKLLTDLNVLCRVLMDDGTLHYRVSARGHHHHLVCRECGRVEDFATCDVTSLVNELVKNTQYQIEGHWLEVYGRCQSCRVLDSEQVQVG
jgi:Fur family ferric uptake transcriptional regulator